jgi:hypothetical protein
MAILFVATVSRRAVRSSPDRVPVTINAVTAPTDIATQRVRARYAYSAKVLWRGSDELLQYRCQD